MCYDVCRVKNFLKFPNVINTAENSQSCEKLCYLDPSGTVETNLTTYVRKRLGIRCSCPCVYQTEMKSEQGENLRQKLLIRQCYISDILWTNLPLSNVKKGDV